MTVAEAIRDAAQRLAETSDTARLDAELLMAHALGVGRSEMLIRLSDAPAPPVFGELVDRRASHEPVAYITGWTEFYGRRFDVEPGVLIPRPDSEVLVEAALQCFEGREPPETILDLGTGSGALLITALKQFPWAEGAATDKSDAVYPVLMRNVERHGDGHTISFSVSDWREVDWAVNLGTFDLILCNPPYVEDDAELDPDVRDYEPASALFSGADGLDDYRILIPQLAGLMTPDAVAIFEIGATQADAVSQIAQKAGFVAEMRRDLANRPRALILRR